MVQNAHNHEENELPSVILYDKRVEDHAPVQNINDSK